MSEQEEARARVEVKRRHRRLVMAETEIIEALELALATIKRLRTTRDFDSTQGTRDVINDVLSKLKGGGQWKD